MEPLRHFSDVRGLIFDMDGVLWRGGQLLPGVQETFTLLRDREIPFVLATNNASQTFESVRSRMVEAGVSVEPHEVLTAAVGTAHHLQGHIPEGSRVFALGSPALFEALRGAGYDVGDSSEGVAAVVVGMDWQLTYEKLAEACYGILEGAFFIGTNPDVNFPTERGLTPGNGALLAALETASGRKPIVFGKPEPHLFNEALQMLGTPLSHTVVVGDRLETDILGGKNAGMPTALVLTGVATSEDAANSNYKPDYMFQDLTSLCEALG